MAVKRRTQREVIKPCPHAAFCVHPCDGDECFLETLELPNGPAEPLSRAQCEAFLAEQRQSEGYAKEAARIVEQRDLAVLIEVLRVRDAACALYATVKLELTDRFADADVVAWLDSSVTDVKEQRTISRVLLGKMLRTHNGDTAS